MKQGANSNSRGKTLTESQQQSWRTLEFDPSQNQCPDETSLMRQEAEPGATVGSDFQIRESDASLRYVQRFISNGDGSFVLFGARKDEVICSG